MGKNKRSRKQKQDEQDEQNALLPEDNSTLQDAAQKQRVADFYARWFGPPRQAMFMPPTAVVHHQEPEPETKPLFDFTVIPEQERAETARDLIEAALESIEKVPPNNMTGYGLIMVAKAENLMREALDKDTW